MRGWKSLLHCWSRGLKVASALKGHKQRAHGPLRGRCYVSKGRLPFVSEGCHHAGCGSCMATKDLSAVLTICKMAVLVCTAFKNTHWHIL